MKKLITILFAVAACGDDEGARPDAATPDASPDSGMQPVTYMQIEHLARPGINEALLITNDFLAGYNATAPSFTGVPPATLTAVVGEAKTVLKAIYLGGCLLNGALGLSAASGVHPAGIECHAVGAAIWTENTLTGVTLTPLSKTKSQDYADKVFDQFVPDVMRIDTAGASAYLTLCGDANTKPLLCGGRNLNDDTIDVTYNYLINGAGTTKGNYDQVRALTSDGVNQSTTDANNVGSVINNPIIANPQQFHPDVSGTFPYAAAPI